MKPPTAFAPIAGDAAPDVARPSSAAATYKAAVLAAPRALRIVSLPVPAIGPTQVLVRLQGCGVCGSNLPVWQGRPWFKYPLSPGAPGHEGWGVIQAVGSEVKHLRVNDRVALLGQHSFAEYDVVEENDAVQLPDELAEQPFPGEPLACAVNAFQRCKIGSGQWVAIVGIGFMGALLTQLAVNAGARVIAISRRAFSLDIARRLGAQHVLPLGHDGGAVISAVRELTGGRLCDCVIEATGFQVPLNLAGELTGERGRLVIAGFHQDGPRQVNMQLWNWRGLDVVNAHERDARVYRAGIEKAISLVKSGELDPAPLYTHRFKLTELGEALDEMQERPPTFLKALIVHD